MIITLRLRNILLRREDVDLDELLTRPDYSAAMDDLCNSEAWSSQVLMNPRVYEKLVASQKAGERIANSLIALRLLMGMGLLADAVQKNGPIANAVKPIAPVIIAPVAGAGIHDPLKIIIGAYRSPMEFEQKSVLIMIKKGAELVYNSGHLPSGTTTHIIENPGFEANTNYQVHVCVTDKHDYHSDWTVIDCHTSENIGSVSIPLLSCSGNLQQMGSQPTLTTGGFAVSVGEDTHVATQWQVRQKDFGWDYAAYDSGEDTENLTRLELPKGVLDEGRLTYFIRVRHKGETLGWSDWSEELEGITQMFFTSSSTLSVVQIAPYSSGLGIQKCFSWGNSNQVPIPPLSDEDFAKHPVFGAIEEVVIDGQHMLKIPKFKTTKGMLENDSNMVFFQLSIEKGDTHPAFYKDNKELDAIYVGKYPGSLSPSGEMLCSVPGAEEITKITLSQAQAVVQARNNNGVNGFEALDFTALDALLWLHLFRQGHGGGGFLNDNSFGLVWSFTPVVLSGISQKEGKTTIVSGGLRIISHEFSKKISGRTSYIAVNKSSCLLACLADFDAENFLDYSYGRRVFTINFDLLCSSLQGSSGEDYIVLFGNETFEVRNRKEQLSRTQTTRLMKR